MDPYVYPGTDILQNLKDIRQAERLARFEADVTARRVAQLRLQFVSASFDTAYLQAINRYIFQDVYEWAGEFRVVNISRSGQFPFAFYEQIGPSLETLFRKLAREARLTGLPSAEFCSRAAYYLGELNAVHPFREGKGRTQREFVRQLAATNGYTIRWSRISRETMSEASRLSFLRGDNTGLTALLQFAVSSPSW